eukprot:1657823-Alexandrium_andersonii.AAC.1
MEGSKTKDVCTYLFTLYESVAEPLPTHDLRVRETPEEGAPDAGDPYASDDVAMDTIAPQLAPGPLASRET